MDSSTPQTPPPFNLRQHLPVAGLVFLLGLGLRLMFLLTSPDRSWPHAVNYEGDAVIWARAADLFAHGQVPDDGVPHRFYAIAHLLHWWAPEQGAPSYLGFKIAWCVLSALACAVGYLTFVRNLPRGPALIATGLCLYSFGSYVLATSLNVEGLYAPLLILILGGTLELARRPSWWTAGALAGLNALALLTREEHLVLLFVLGGYVSWLWWRPAANTVAAPVRPPPPATRIAQPLAVIAGAILLCLPYSLHATRATVHYNTVPKRLPNYGAAGLDWSPEARAFIEALPAFVRAKTVDLVNQRSAPGGVRSVSADAARDILVDFFGYLPDPLSTPVFIASHGPMSFALSNHPEANGGFSRAALETRTSQQDPRLNLTLPSHLRIFNHGYAVGWGYITAGPARWASNVARKLGHAYQGAALGFTAYNIPLGRHGQRRPCDLLTPFPGAAVLAWQLAFGGLLLIGALVGRRQRLGQLCLLVIAYKTVIVIAYYGYSRQTVSILPVFLVLAGLGIDHLVTLLGRHLRGGLSARQRRGAAVTLLAAACLLDLHAARHPVEHDIAGATRPLPEFGDNAFSSNAHLDLRPRE